MTFAFYGKFLQNSSPNADPGEFINGEFTLLLKPLTYGAKDHLQIYLKPNSTIDGIYKIHRDQDINTVLPGGIIADGPQDLFKACDYENYINTKYINNDCESAAFVI